MKFIMENERCWIGASQFYAVLTKLGIPTELYQLQLPCVLSAKELDYYLDSLENDLRATSRSGDHYWYAKQICTKLRKWTDRGYIIHVVA